MAWHGICLLGAEQTMPIQLKLPESQRLATMVVHTRPMLLREREHLGLYLYYGVRPSDIRLPVDPDAAEEVLPANHVADFSDPVRLAELRDWLHNDIRKDKAFNKLFGRDPVFLHALALARETARLQGEVRNLPPVLIQGPSGSGKELVARAIHEASGRIGRFVPIHCAGITPELLEDTLFGHIRGAYTGAQGARVGLVELANDGTLFIDEVADLPIQAQVGLLRFLQDQKYRPIGANDEKQANVRIICATWKPIDDLAKSGEFRHDLLYRICGVRIFLPGLKDRKHEILGLAEAIVQDAGVSVEPPLDPEATLAIRSTKWPGGLRQLDRELREAVRKSQGKTIRLEHFPPERIVNFHGAAPEVRIAATALAWSPSGRRPTPEESRVRLIGLLDHLYTRENSQDAPGEVALVQRVQDAFQEDDPTHHLLSKMLKINECRILRLHQRQILESLQDYLPEGVTGHLVRERLAAIAKEQQEEEVDFEIVSKEFSQRLPGLAQIFAFVYAIPGIGEHQRNRLLQASAQVVSIVAQLLPGFVGFVVRTVVVNRLESFVMEEEQPDPTNPFNNDGEPSDRSVEDWKWLADNATSLAEAERLSRYAKNTIRKYFTAHSLTIDRTRSDSINIEADKIKC